jgi:hypothetical protein
VAMERVLEVSEIHAAPSLRGQGALGVVAAYMQSYNAFLYACISHAAQACGQQLQQRAPQDLDVPRAAFVAVAVRCLLCSLLCSLKSKTKESSLLCSLKGFLLCSLGCPLPCSGTGAP